MSPLDIFQLQLPSAPASTPQKGRDGGSRDPQHASPKKRGLGGETGANGGAQKVSCALHLAAHSRVLHSHPEPTPNRSSSATCPAPPPGVPRALTKAVQNVIKVVEIVVAFFHHCPVPDGVVHPAIGICHCAGAEKKSRNKQRKRGG